VSRPVINVIQSGERNSPLCNHSTAATSRAAIAENRWHLGDLLLALLTEVRGDSMRRGLSEYGFSGEMKLLPDQALLCYHPEREKR